jgi:hypothetical protein
MGSDDSGGGGKGGGGKGDDSGPGYSSGPSSGSADFSGSGISGPSGSGAPMNIMPDAAQFEPTPTGSFIPSSAGSSAAGASVATEPGFSSGFSPGAFDASGGFDQPDLTSGAGSSSGNVPVPTPRPADAPQDSSALTPSEAVPIPQPRPADAPQPTSLGTGANTGSTTSLASPQGLTAAPSGPSATAAPTGASGSDLSAAGDKKGGGFSMADIVTPKNALAAAGTGFNLFQSAKASKGVPSTAEMSAKIQQQASELNAQGKELAKYLQSGTLPEGLKTQLNTATAAAKARLISNYAAQGMPTDPRKNSALAQQLGMIDQQAIITTAQIGQQLLDQGIKESGMASDLYSKLINVDQTQTARIGQAISQMSAALNGASASKTATK